MPDDTPNNTEKSAKKNLDQRQKNLQKLKGVFQSREPTDTVADAQVGEDIALPGVDASEAQAELGDSTVSPRFSDLRRRMANEQGVIEATSKEAAKLVPETLLTLGEYAGYILDFQSYDDIVRGGYSVAKRMAGEDPGEINVEDLDNSWSQLMREGKEWVEEQAPVYRKDPGDIMDWDDPAFYIKNLQDLASSVMAFWGVGAGAGAALRAGAQGVARGINAGAKVSRVLQGSSQVGTTAALSMSEGMGEAMQSYQSTYQTALKNHLDSGKSRQEAERLAKQAAGEMAATTTAINTSLLMPLNFLSVSPLFRSMDDMKALSNAKLAPQGDELLKPQKYINRLQNQGFDQTFLQKYSPALRESVFESLEEVSNTFAGGEGQVRAQQLMGEDPERDLGERITHAFTSDEGRLSALLGAIGGSAQHVGIKHIPTKRTEEGWVSPAQQEAEAKVQQYQRLRDQIVDRVNNFKDAQEDLRKASEEGSEAKMEEARDRLMNDAMLDSVILGTEHHIRGLVDEMQNMSEEEAKKRGFDTDPESPTYYKKVAEDYKKEVDHLSKQWKKHQSDFNWGVNEKDAAIPELLFRRYASIRRLERVNRKMQERQQEAREAANQFPDAMGQEVNVEQEAHKLERARLQALNQMLQNIEGGDFKEGFENEQELMEAAGFEEVWGNVTEQMPKANGLANGEDAASYLRGRLQKDLKNYTQNLNGRSLEEVTSDLQEDLESLEQPEGGSQTIPPVISQKLIESTHRVQSSEQDTRMLGREYDYLTSSEGRAQMVQRFREAQKREEQRRLKEVEETAKEMDEEEAQNFKEDLPDNDAEGKKKVDQEIDRKKTQERKEAVGPESDIEESFDPQSRIAEKKGKAPSPPSDAQDGQDQGEDGDDSGGPPVDTEPDNDPEPTTPQDPSKDHPPKRKFDPKREAEGADVGVTEDFDPRRRIEEKTGKSVKDITSQSEQEESTPPKQRLQDQIKQAAYHQEKPPSSEASEEVWQEWENRRISDLNEVREDWLSDPMKNVPQEEVNRRVDNMIERVQNFRKENIRDAAQPREPSDEQPEPSNPSESPEGMETQVSGNDPAKPRSPGHTIAYLSRQWTEGENGQKQTASNERVSEDVKLAELPEFVNNGTRLTYEVQDGDINTEADVEENLDTAHIEVTAHLEDGTTVRLGALPEAVFEKMRDRTIGDNSDVQQQLKDLRNLRDTVLRAHVSNEVDTIRGRVIGKTGGQVSVKYQTDEEGNVIPGERDFRRIEDALENTGLEFFVAGDDGVYTRKNQKDDTVKNDANSLKAGTAGVIIPLSNGERLAVPVWLPTLEDAGLAETVSTILSSGFDATQRRQELSKLTFLRRGDVNQIFNDPEASGDDIRVKVTDSGHIFLGRVNSGVVFTNEARFHGGNFRPLWNSNGEVREEARELIGQMLMNVDLERINQDEFAGGFKHLKTVGDGVTTESYESYNEFLRQHLRTDLLETQVEGPDGSTHYLYSEQPSIYHDVTLDDGSPDNNYHQDPTSEPDHQPSDPPAEEEQETTLEDMTVDELATIGGEVLAGFDSRPQAAYNEVVRILREIKRRYDTTENEEFKQVGQNLQQRLEAVLEGPEEEAEEDSDQEVEEDSTPINFDQREEPEEAPIADRDVNMDDLDSPVVEEIIKEKKDPRRDMEHLQRLLDRGDGSHKKLLRILRENWDLPREGHSAYNSTQVMSYLRKQIEEPEEDGDAQDVEEEASDLSASDLDAIRDSRSGLSGMRGGAFSLASEKTPAKTFSEAVNNAPARETNMDERTYERLVEEAVNRGDLRISCRR